MDKPTVVRTDEQTCKLMERKRTKFNTKCLRMTHLPSFSQAYPESNTIRKAWWVQTLVNERFLCVKKYQNDEVEEAIADKSRCCHCCLIFLAVKNRLVERYDVWDEMGENVRKIYARFNVCQISQGVLLWKASWRGVKSFVENEMWENHR